jgi:hypothetical protein
MRLLAALRGVQLAFICLGGWKAFGLRAPNRPHKDLVSGRGLGFSLELREKLEVTQSLWRCLPRWFADDVKLEKILFISLMGAVFRGTPMAPVSLVGAVFGGAPIAPVSLVGAVLGGAPIAPVSLVGAVLGGAPITPVCLPFEEEPKPSEEEGKG